MIIQLDIIDLINNLKLELNNKLYTLATSTYWKWRELLASVENDYMYELLEKLYKRTARRFERLGLVGGV